MAMTECTKCEQARANAKEHGHRSAEGVCFDHAGIDWEEFKAGLPAAERAEIERLADDIALTQA